MNYHDESVSLCLNSQLASQQVVVVVRASA